MATGDSTNEKYNEEYIEDPGTLDQNRSYNLLKVEHEKCKQEIYDLKRKFELNEAILRDVNEANESLERLLNQRISENKQLTCQVKEKHRTLVKEYENTISNLETKSAQQTREIEELRQRADQCATDQCVTVNRQSGNISFDTDDISLKNRIDELLSIQQEERKKYEHAEQSITELKSRCEHYERYIQGIKDQLDEKDQTLEETRAELALKRSEVESLRTDPTRESCKGNSIFAEVEDRRQKVVNKMNALREKYVELKRTCKSQITEIKSLRTERAAILGKLENDAHYTLTENEELIQKYKSRISNLENKLKSEIKRNSEFDSKQSNCSDASFRYFESLLDSKKKETVELRTTVEDLRTKLLLQQETKANITKQLHYWRYKASSLEDQVHAMEAKLKSSAANDAEHKVSKELRDPTYKYNIDTTTDKKQFTPNQQPRNSVESSQNYSLEIEHSSIKNSDRYKAYRQRTDKENCNHNRGTAELEIITQKSGNKFQCNQTTTKNEDKLLAKFPHSTKNATTRESKSLPGAAEYEYPVIYIPADLNDE
ncbi:hypothetical protein WN51_09045 [Melipona quadrifasciata]|uniref:Protein Spindly n=1 Tax=Melipona quadrifasciata TaxID=166423 RepID=A0A0N0U6X6_9HYME|nr:hypothetical protein WN51_09045 [Melipona quadrifasciata]